jgi:hypothetical protein
MARRGRRALQSGLLRRSLGTGHWPLATLTYIFLSKKQNTTCKLKFTGSVMLKNIITFCVGGLMYGGLELLCRRYTHVSMLIAGGICFLFLTWLSMVQLPFIMKCIIGGLIITAVEFIAGAIVNLWLGINVWDYSHELWNFKGQICLKFSLLWCGLSGVVFWSYERLQPVLLRLERYLQI